MATLSRALGFFAPDIEVLEFPAWDCLPYDRVSPHAAVVAQRMTALARLARVKGRDRPAVLLTTVNADPAARAARARSWRSNRCRPRPATCCRWPASPSGSSSTASIAPRPCARPATTRCAAASSICSRPAWTSRCGSISSATRWRRSAASIRRRQRTTSRAARARSRADGGVSAHLRHHPAVSHRLCRGVRRRRARRCALRSGERRPPLRRHGALAATVPPTAGDAVRLSCRRRRSRSSRWPRKPRTSGWRRSPTITRRARIALRIRPAAAAPYKPLPPDRLYLAEAEWRERLDDAALARLTPFCRAGRHAPT